MIEGGTERGQPGCDASDSTGPVPLARRTDFRLAAALVRPSQLKIEGPAGSTSVEPRVMQVLLALADAGGTVLTRDDLIRLCWHGTVVGDDSIHRAIGELRRTIRATAAGFTVETVPRVGYRLEGAAPTEPTIADDPAPAAGIKPGPTRRRVIAGSLAAGAGVLGWWWLARQPADPRYVERIEHGRSELSYGTSESYRRAVRLLREAVAIEPERAEGWGWLAVALERALFTSTQPAPGEIGSCERTVQRALALDPREPNARTALVMLRRFPIDRVALETELKSILADAPDNVAPTAYLGNFLQGVGRCREAWVFNERALRLDPLSPTHQHRRALVYWIFGRNNRADQVIERATNLWPRHPYVWNSRLLIFASTGRPRAAIAMLDDADGRPGDVPPSALDFWRKALTALETRSPVDIATVRITSFEVAKQAPGLAANAVMVLSMLGELDAAYEVAEGFLMRRGPVVGQTVNRQSGPELYSFRGWRGRQWLFTPATAAFRADLRFTAFCEGIGHVDYWRSRGVWPDPFVRGSLAVA